MTLTTVNPALLDTQAQYTGFKNRLFNGNMSIDQRNAGASITVSSGSTSYPVDRMLCYVETGSNGTFTAQRSTVVPAGFSNSLLFTTATADSSITASEGYSLQQRVEGFNVADLGWGAASAQSVTLSFWVRSSLTGTFAGSISNGSFNRAYVFTFSISAANTWEQKTITISGDTAGSWNTSNGTGLIVYWSLGAGSGLQQTAGSWGGFGYATSGSVSPISTAGATFYITGVQLEKGSTATSFDYRPYGTELVLCQRYYEKQNYDTGESYDFIGLAVSNSTSSALLAISWKVLKRAIPTVTTSAVGSFRLNVTGGADGTVTQLSTSTINVLGVQLTVVRSAAQTVGNAAYVNREGVVSPCFIAASAEL